MRGRQEVRGAQRQARAGMVRAAHHIQWDGRSEDGCTVRVGLGLWGGREEDICFESWKGRGRSMAAALSARHRLRV